MRPLSICVFWFGRVSIDFDLIIWSIELINLQRECEQHKMRLAPIKWYALQSMHLGRSFLHRISNNQCFIVSGAWLFLLLLVPMSLSSSSPSFEPYFHLYLLFSYLPYSNTHNFMCAIWLTHIPHTLNWWLHFLIHKHLLFCKTIPRHPLLCQDMGNWKHLPNKTSISTNQIHSSIPPNRVENNCFSMIIRWNVVCVNICVKFKEIGKSWFIT